ncbi:cadherin-like beta sandwich domain-containing protein [Cohnella phaseoli]|uniref:S-layer family protein n=1 Tax=Cohnella phaseoli TaxID=456490 RepID=A0A3D9HR20_9BACL|nr:cadherin-like beta sandwich domain-containing protein [Cohnella phaseoli]RED51920.1 S-layer family protein [Cohnella phaseoli]
MRSSLFSKVVQVSLSFILVTSLFLGYLAPGAHAATKDPIPAAPGPREIDYHGGFVYAAHRVDASNPAITRTSLANSAVETVVTNVSYVMSVALNIDGDLFYTRDSDPKVYKIPASSLTAGLPVDGSTASVYATFDSNNTMFLYATAFDSEGNLYVANNRNISNPTIIKVGKGGSPVTEVVGGFTRTIVGMAISLDGDLYIQDEWNKFYRVSSDDLALGSGASYEEITGIPSIPSNGGLASLPDGSIIYSSGNTFNYLVIPLSPPGIEFVGEPIPLLDPTNVNHTASVVTSVYSLGSKPVFSRGIEYRAYSEDGTEPWINLPYDGATPQTKGSFTTVLNGLVWLGEYEVRGYATSEVGTSYTATKRFTVEVEDNMNEWDVRFDRIGPSVLHVKDKKRVVAVGEGVMNLLRRPLSEIHYTLQFGGNVIPLEYRIINETQLELTWKADLDPGVYEVHLEHDKYTDIIMKDDPATEESEGLTIVNTDFYKPRNFDSIEVPSTSPSSGNDLSVLKVQGPFTELPTTPGLYTLNDPNEVVTLNGNVLFKGSSLQVDKTGADGKTVVRGDGRLFVNASIQGATVPYTLYEGAFSFSSDQFSLALNGGEAVDYLRLNMPFKPSSVTFVKGGVNLAGQLELGFTAGNQKVSGTVPVDALQYRNNRFDLIGTYTLNKSFKLGPIDASNTKFVIDSRFPYVSVTGKGNLPGTSIGLDLYMDLKQGHLDELSFDTFKKANFASTGLQIDYLFGDVGNLAGKTQIPQRFRIDGSVTDILVPQLKHPSAAYKFNLLGTDNISVDLTPYGLEASGIEYYYWLAVKQMKMQAVVNPSIAGLKSFSQPGFIASGDINAFDVIKGTIGAYSFNKKGYSGAVKATVYVPKGIPRIGGATVRDVVLSVNEKQIIGVFKHNGIGARVSYTFANNTIFFEVEAEPPKKSWWEKGLDFLNGISDFFDKIAPLGDILEEIFLYNPSDDMRFRLAATGDWKKDFDFGQFNRTALVAATGDMERVYELTPVSLAAQPISSAEPNAAARIADGQLTAVDRTPSMSAQADASGGRTTFGFRADRAFEALIVLTGDQRDAVLKFSAGDKPNAENTVQTEAVYEAGANKTYVRAELAKGDWKLTAQSDSRILVNELLFANPSLTQEQLAKKWEQTPERPIYAAYLEERGSFALAVDAGPSDAIIYKPDGRPYYLQTATGQPGWNAFRDADGIQHALIGAAEAGTWLIVSDENPSSVRIGRVPSQTSTDELKAWAEAKAYPSTFELPQTSNGQAIVEIYGAGEDTILYAPNGEPYSLQPDSGKSGMNVVYDQSQAKMTVWVDGVSLKGQWKAVGSDFVSIAAYKSSRKFKSIKPLLDEGRYSKIVELAEKGDYMLSIGGGSTDTVILDPSGKVYRLNFSDPDGNAYVQPASDRVPASATGADPLDVPKVDTPTPAIDGRDHLYVTLLNAPAGKWTIQNKKSVEVDIQKLIPLPEVKASVAAVAGAENRIRVDWSTEHAAPGTEATIMLTDGGESFVGEVLAEELAASGSKVIDIPAGTVPGTFSISVMAASADEAPAYAIAEGTVEVKSAYELAAPGAPQIVSAGNGEATLSFASVSGQVDSYRIWIGEGAEVQPATPAMDIEPQPGAAQQAVISGLPENADYTVAVTAVGSRDGRLAVSPMSDSVSFTLSAPQPAALDIGVDAGTHPVASRDYTAYDGSDGTLLITAAKQASLTVNADKAAELSLTVDGQIFDNVQVPANGSHAFDLNELLGMAELEEREYNVQIEATNERDDRSVEFRRLVVDSTKPLLIASGGNNATGAPISLNGTVDSSGKVFIVGQTEVGATLEIDGVNVPLDGEGRFAYYAPIAWGGSGDRQVISMQAVDAAGNVTPYGFEVLKDFTGPWETYPSDLAALTVDGALLNAPYQFGTLSYQATAESNKVRIYAVPMVASSIVTIDGQTLATDGYVEVEVPAGGRTVQIQVQPDGSGPGKSYSLQLTNGSSVALLNGLTLKTQTGETVAAPKFTGTEEVYEVNVDNAVEGVKLTLSSLMAGSTITVDSKAVQNGQASETIALLTGENTIPVAVVAPNGLQSRSYEVVVWREASGNAELQQLGIATSGATLGTTFDPNVADYRLLVPSGTTELTLQPIAQQPDAVVRVNEQAVTGSPVSLPFGGESMTVVIEVRAQDKSARQYTLNVVRQKNAPAAPPLLDSLEASAALDGDFAPYKLNYGTKTRLTGGSMTVKATTSDPQATVTVMGKTLQGGGSFTPNLAMGLNTISIQVESADLTASQTYSIDVTRVSSGGSGSTEAVRQSTVIGGAGGWMVQIPIVRTTASDGSVIDTVKLDADKAKDVVAKAKQSKTSVARIQVADMPGDPADERFVSLSAQAMTLLSGSGISLQIELPEGIIELRTDSLKQLGSQGKDAYFRIVPIVKTSERSEVNERVLKAELVRQAANSQPVTVIGRPVKIETNFSGYKTELLLRIDGLKLPTDESAARRMLSGLAVYIEHSDGEKKLAQGEIRFEGGKAGIVIEVDKFSTFTTVQIGSGDTTGETLEPYLSGYPDGTFGPSQSIKRSEFAMILHRLGLSEGTTVGEVSGYKDVTNGHWAAEAIAAMQRSGLMRGDNQGMFRPESAVTRAEMASIVARLLPPDGAIQIEPVVPNDAKGHWAAGAIGKALQADILKGYPDGTFRPDRTLTRAEAVRVLNQLLERPTAEVSASSWPDVPASHWAIREIESASGNVIVSEEGGVQIKPVRNK